MSVGFLSFFQLMCFSVLLLLCQLSETTKLEAVRVCAMLVSAWLCTCLPVGVVYICSVHDEATDN